MDILKLVNDYNSIYLDNQFCAREQLNNIVVHSIPYLPVLHKDCNGIVFWYTGGLPVRHEARSIDVKRLDGSIPAYKSEINMICPKCLQPIHSPNELVVYQGSSA